MKFSLGVKIGVIIIAVFMVEGYVALKYSQSLTENSLKKIINEEFTQTMVVMQNQIAFMEQSNIHIAKTLIHNLGEFQNIDLQKDMVALDVDSVVILDKKGDLLLQSGALHIEADSLQTFHVVHESLKTKQVISRIERVGDMFVFFTAVPVINKGTLQGEILIGLQISNKILQEVSRGSSIKLSIIGDRVIGATSFADENGNSLLENLPVSYIEYLRLLHNTVDLLTVEINKKEYFMKAKELDYVDEDTTNASMMLLYEKEDYNKQLMHIKNIQFILLWILVISLLLTLIGVFLYLRKNFTLLITGLKRISQGIYGETVTINTNDELQTVAEYFNEMSKAIEEKDNTNKQHMAELEKKIKDIRTLKEHEKTLYKKATRDRLTSLYNREKFETIFEFMVETANREKKKLAYAIVDIDHFKSVNDTYGHSIGDEILKKVATILSTSIRKNDLVARWGGEEFVLAMLVSNIDEVKVILDNLRKTIAQSLFDLDIKITVSFGVTLYKNEDLNKTFTRADKALYTAKNNGRNRVEVKL